MVAEHRGGIGSAVGPEPGEPVVDIPIPTRVDGVRSWRFEPPDVPLPELREYSSPASFWLPNWVRALVGREASVEEIVGQAIARVTERPTHDRVIETLHLFNELSKDPEHAQVIRSLFPTEFLAAMMARAEQ